MGDGYSRWIRDAVSQERSSTPVVNQTGTIKGFTNTDGDSQADCVDADDDNVGISDADETAAGSDPLNGGSGGVAGINTGGDYATFPGVVGTAVSQVCDLEVARTGLKEGQTKDAGFEVFSARSRTPGRGPATTPETAGSRPSSSSRCPRVDCSGLRSSAKGRPPNESTCSPRPCGMR